MSQLSVDSVIPQSGTTVTLGASGDTINIPSGVTMTNSGTASGFGKVLQVVQTVKSDIFSTAATNFTDITGISASITPSSSSNKILIQVSIGTHDVSAAAVIYYRLMRDSTPIGVGDSGIQSTFAATINNDRGEGQGMMYLDSPSSTSSINYKLQGYPSGSSTLYINYRNGSSYYTISTITLMEIAG
jgi:hypothetical protein